MPITPPVAAAADLVIAEVARAWQVAHTPVCDTTTGSSRATASATEAGASVREVQRDAECLHAHHRPRPRWSL
jgi:hypothetical protein